jgi:hypothetical protein
MLHLGLPSILCASKWMDASYLYAKAERGYLQAKGEVVGNKVGPAGYPIHRPLIVRPRFFLQR